MGITKAPPSLDRLRQSLAGLDPTLAPRLQEAQEGAFGLGIRPIDRALAGGLASGALHELAPSAPMHLGAATGFATALAALAGSRRGEVLWVATYFAQAEAGIPYGPGLDGLGLAAKRLVLLRVPRALDVLWAMEEALRCRALGGVLAELTEDAVPDLTATRRLALAARDGAGFGFLLRQRPSGAPTAAATRWLIAGSASEPDPYGGLGPAAFDLALIKNRRGPTGRWTITWDHHECVFRPAVSLGVAEAAVDRSDRAPFVRAG